MRRAATLTEFAIRCGVHQAHVVRFLGISKEELELLDSGQAEIPDSDIPELARRIGRSCDEIDLRRVLADVKRVPCPAGLQRRLGECSMEWQARAGEKVDAPRFLDERFPDVLERRQVVGPNDAGNFEWRRVIVRFETGWRVDW
jgi:hypothetical protein